MKVAVIGLGYIGLANFAVLQDGRNQVVGFDKNEEKAKALNNLTYPFEEKELRKNLQKLKNNSIITSDPKHLSDCDAYFIAVGTPSKEDGSCDLSAFKESVSLVREYASKKDTYLVIRSTVNIGTADSLRKELTNDEVNFHIVSMPEFLREGTSYSDELNPDRIVVGAKKEEEGEFVVSLRKDIKSKGIPVYYMSNISAEITKYASNSFLAVKIAYANEISRLCDLEGGNILDVMNSVGADARIGRSMLGAGAGFGGSCLPKDLRALKKEASSKNLEMPFIEAAIDSNRRQINHFIAKMEDHLGGLKGKKIAVLGLAFKAGISDTRESVSSFYLDRLLEKGAIVRAYDPSPLARESLKKSYAMSDSLLEAANNADAILILTAAEEFKNIVEEDLLKVMHGRIIFDGRNIFSLTRFRYFDYVSIGRKDVKRKI